MSADTLLSLEAERQRPEALGISVFQNLYDDVRQWKAQLGLQDDALRLDDCHGVRGDELPPALCKPPYLPYDPARQVPLPALWNSLGMLEYVAGRHGSAAAFFQAAAAALPESPARGQIWFNAYLNDVQAGNKSEALAALETATYLDPARFSLFPRDRYLAQQLLGIGGFAVAFRCLDRRTGRPVVVKALHADMIRLVDADIFHEAAILSELDHPAIVRLVEHGYASADQTRPFLVVEYFDGLTLHDYVRHQGPLSVENLLVVARLMAEALQATHARGIWHRDIKPSNILIRCDHAGWQVKLIDFSAALRAGTEHGPIVRIGTEGYAAPEQMGALPGAVVGPHTDVYGFGRTCCFALFGDPRTLDYSRGPLLPALRVLLNRCVQERPEARCADFTQVLMQLPDVRQLTEPDQHLTARTAPVPNSVAVPSPPSAAASAPPPPERTGAGAVAAPERTGTGVFAVPGYSAPEQMRPLPSSLPPVPAKPPTTRVNELPSGVAVVQPIPQPAPSGPVFSIRPPLGRLARLAARIGGWFRRHPSIEQPADSTETVKDTTERDPVDCTVFAPPDAHGGDALLIQVFAHRPEQAETARRMAKEYDDRAQARGFKSLEIDVERGSVLRFHLVMPGLHIDEPEQPLTWRGRTEPVTFAVTVPANQPLGAVIGTVNISQDGVPVGRIRFKLLILAPSQQPTTTPTPCGEEATRYQMVFISYSSADRDEVLKRVQMLRRLKINFFQDVLNLEPGDRWEKELYRYIDRSDLFLLFWSSSARDSEWVMKEVRYALQRQGGREDAPPAIMPVILEGPPIPAPPPELDHLHFNDQILHFVSRPTR